MKKLLMIAAGAAAALTFTGVAAAAVSPWVYNPLNVCPGVTSTLNNGVLHLAKPCPTSTNAAAGATLTGSGVSGSFSSGQFTLASAIQCHGGSPRFNVVTSDGTFFLGCNNVDAVINSNGTATYVFTPTTLHIGLGVSWPTGTIQSVDIMIDFQDSADISKISVNGEPQTAKHPKASEACKHGGWKNFHNPSFKNQGQCVSYFNHHNGKGHDDDHSDNGKGHHDDDHSDYGHGHHH